MTEVTAKLASAATCQQALPDRQNLRRTSPEVINGQLCSTKADVYSFALLMYEVTAKKVPFGDKWPVEMAAKAVQSGERPLLPEDCPERLQTLIHQCWSQESTSRPGMSEVRRQLESMLQLVHLTQ